MVSIFEAKEIMRKRLGREPLDVEVLAYFQGSNEDFLPPYSRQDLSLLDALHSHVGLGEEWQNSSERAKLEDGDKNATIHKPWVGDSRSQFPKHGS